MAKTATRTPANELFGANLKYYLDENGLSAAQFADQLGVAKQTVFRWLNGRIPESPHLDNCAEALGLDVADLFVTDE